MEKGQIMWDKLIKWIIALIVGVGVIYATWYGLTTLNQSVNGLSWNSLSLSEQSKISDNFNSFISLLNSCQGKFNCFCGNTAGFPFAFRNEETIVINNSVKGKALITLMHKDFKVNDATLNQNLFLNSGLFTNYVISFQNSQYLVDGTPGISDRQAFVRAGDSMYVFNSKVEKTNSVYKASLNMSVCR